MDILIPLYSIIIQKALIGCILAGLLCGLLSVFIVRINLSSIGYCMSHSAFAGAALAVAIGADPLFLALIFSSIMALITGPVTDRAKLPLDIVLGIAFSLNMALAFIFLSFTKGPFVREVLSILWGSLLTLTELDLQILLALCAIFFSLVYLFWKEYFTILFNRKMAEADGIRTRPLVYAIIFISGVVVAASLKLVGGLLVFTLLFNPAATVMQFLCDMRKIAVMAPIMGVFMCSSGLLLSLILDWPIGACIVITSTIIFAFSVILSPRRRRRGSFKR